MVVGSSSFGVGSLVFGVGSLDFGVGSLAFSVGSLAFSVGSLDLAPVRFDFPAFGDKSFLTTFLLGGLLLL